jgi:ATP phosphoribosyltransferase regulatory subunit
LLTVDPCEFRGFEYHTGISFTLFAQGVRGELGAGGRYLAGPAPNGGREPATGFTIYLDSLMRALPAAAPGPMVFLPPGTSRAVARHLRAEGWTALQSLNEAENSVAEARRLGCSHVWRDGKIEPLGS